MLTPDDTEALQLDRRSLTAAAIRRGDVKISEPRSWEIELHSSPSTAQRNPPTAGGSKANIAVAQYRPPEEAGGPKTNANVTQRRSDESLPHGRDADEAVEAPLSQPLRHKQASLSMREDSEVQ